MGSGPARGNGNSSRQAESAAAAHNFQAPRFNKERCIQGRVYSIRVKLAVNAGNRVTIGFMLIAVIGMRFLEVMFFVGLAGSSVVVLISFVEDGKELFGKDE
jgi:hypothetical protein